MSLEYNVSKKEKMYLIVKVAASLIFYFPLLLFAFFAGGAEHLFSVLSSLLILMMFLSIIPFILQGMLIGYIRGSGIQLTKNQFPDLYETAVKQSKRLDLRKIPEIYILQGNGLLNAFATRFLGGNFVVLYSDVVELAYQEGNQAVEFIMGHELGHIKRRHLNFVKTILLFPSLMIPFLQLAYMRGCEYTCDSIGVSLSSKKGGMSGLKVLAAGKLLHQKMNVDEYVLRSEQSSGFWTWLVEIFSTHPRLPKRLKAVSFHQEAENPQAKGLLKEVADQIRPVDSNQGHVSIRS